MARKIKPGKGGSPGQPYQAPKEDPKNPYVPAPRLAKGKSLFSTPYYDDLRNINKFKENADKVFKRIKKASNKVNEA